MPEVECPECGKPFHCSPSRLARVKEPCCSTECAVRHRVYSHTPRLLLDLPWNISREDVLWRIEEMRQRQ